MELRRVDPRTLKKNLGNPRKIQPGEMSDAALKATIKVVGVIQPPTVSEQDGALTIVYGSRRVRFADAGTIQRRAGARRGAHPHGREETRRLSRIDPDGATRSRRRASDCWSDSLARRRVNFSRFFRL